MADEQFDIPSIVLASDTIDAQQGFFSRLEDATVKGIPAAAISGAMSVYNTFLDYSGNEMVDVQDAIEKYGPEGAGQYYADNKQVIDFAGFAATSIIPGALGIKALKLAQAGKAMGPIGRTLGIPFTRKNEYMRQAIMALGQSGGSMTSAVTAAKRAQMAWGVADNVLMSAAAELAVVGTMNDSPIFEGSDAWDFAQNVMIGAAFGGAVGGAIDSLATRGAIKSVQRQVEKYSREFETIFDPKNIGLSTADEIATLADNILKLPDDVWNTNVEFFYGGKKNTWTLDTQAAFSTIRGRAEKVAFDNLKLQFNELAEQGEITGQAMFKFIKQVVDEGRSAKLPNELIRDNVQGYLLNIKRITPVAENAENPLPKQFFISKQPTGLHDLFSEVRGKGTGKQAYYLTTTDPAAIRFGKVTDAGLVGLRKAFAEGYDAVMTTTGKIAINPKSQVIKRTPDQALSTKFFLDLETGALTPNPVVRAVDTVKSASEIKIAPGRVTIGAKDYAQEASKKLNLNDSAFLASTRYMWAQDGLTEAAIIKQRVIEWNDFPVLEKFAQSPLERWINKNIKIRLKDGTELDPLLITSVPNQINRFKLEALQDAFNEAGKAGKHYDLRFLSDHFNVSQKWIEDAIATGFSPNKELIDHVRGFKEYFKPRTLQLEWDAALPQVVNGAGKPITTQFVGPNFGATATMSLEYRMQTHLRQQGNAFDAVMGADAERFLSAADDLALQSSEQGSGASSFGASNADYGKRAEHWAQENGKQVAIVSQRWREEAIGVMSPHISAIRDNLEASAELGIVTNLLRKDTRRYYLHTGVDVKGKPVYQLVDREAVKLAEKGELSLDEAIEWISSTHDVRGVIELKNKAVYDFLDASTGLNAGRVQKQTVLSNAMGVARELDHKVVYAPPVNTSRYPYFAFVVNKPRPGAVSEVTMITAKSDDQLRNLAAKVGDDHEVIYKNDTKKFFKAKAQYDYDMQLNESKVNSTLQRNGVLADFFPETRAENVLEDYVRWHGNATENLVRSAVQVKNRRFYSEMGFLSELYTAPSTSKFAGFGASRSKIADPFGDYIKTSLNISKQSEYPLLDSFNEFIDGVGKRAYKAIDDAWSAFTGSEGKDLLALNKVEELMDYHGLKSPYSEMATYLEANEKVPKNLIKTAFQKVNYWLATMTLRLDFANSLINMISTPIMLGMEMQSIRGMVAKNPELAGKLAELTHVKVPGQQAAVPSTTKLIGKAISNFFGEGKKELLERYVANGDVRTTLQLYHEVLDDMAYMPNRKAAEWVTKLNKGVDKAARITGNEFSEELTRFVSADVMRQLTDPLVDAGKMTIREQNAYMSSFVNRVQGNYISSQRPVVFQGTTGAAVGLFQTYAFNVLQQLLRHMEARDAKTLLTFAGLQSSIYGMNGLPFFDAINAHLIGNAAGNKGHVDAYSLLPQANKELGDWMLYGTASAFPLFGDKSPALYTRGDINPRHLSILPVHPLDIPAVNASLKLLGTVGTLGKNLVNGADISGSLLQALEHQGWNRPLAGFAQLLAGQSTTGKGSLVSAANDMETTTMLSRIPERLVNYGGIARVMGSRPMDEAIALSGFYRNKAYEAKDRARLEAFGQAVKTKLYGNQVPDDDEFEDLLANYQAAGGRVETFSSSLQRWMKDSNSSIVNEMARKVRSPYAQKMMVLMGGEELPDYRSPSE